MVSIAFSANALEMDNQLLKIVLFWFSLSYPILGLIYFINKPKLFYKSKNSGKLSIISNLAILPYFLIIYSIWFFKYKFSKENKYDFFFENYYIGKKLIYKDLPNDIEIVVDLTAELNEDYSIIQNKKYISFPILDASIPDEVDFYLFIKEVSKLRSNIYIHCAEGHGRTALVAIILYLIRNKKQSVEEAFEFIKGKRRKIKLNKEQESFLNKFVKSEYFLNI